MVRRITENRSDTPLNIRLPANLKIEVDKAADLENVSTAEWVRKTLQEKIDNMRAEKEGVPRASAANDFGPLTYARVRDLVMRCLDDVGIIYKKDSAAAAEEEQRPAGSTELRDNP